RGSAQAVLTAGDVDRPAVDIFRDQERLAVRRRAAVDELADRGVREPGQDLALGEEPPARLLARQAASGEGLERHPLAIGAVGPLGQEHPAHPALSQLAQNVVAIDARGQRRRVPLAARAPGPSRPPSAQPAGVGVGGLGRGFGRLAAVRREQALELAGQLGILAGEVVEQASSLGLAGLRGRDEQLLEASPALGGHRGPAPGPPSSRASQAWAIRQSRLTVARETPTVSATSESGSPAKIRSSAISAWRASQRRRSSSRRSRPRTRSGPASSAAAPRVVSSHPEPLLPAWRRRARSTRIWRMARAATL